jgi:integrase
MRNLVLPAFEGYTLREITVARVDRFLKAQAKTSYSRAKQAKTVLSLAFGLAVRYGAVSKNPVRDVARLRRSKSKVKALSVEEIEAVRAAVQTWRRGNGLSGPKPDGQMEAIIDVMLGTSARIGEALAIRKCDVDVTSTPATVTICGTIVTPKGSPTHRQDHPKTDKSYRTVAVPSFTADVLRQRLVKLADEHPEHLLFYSRNHTPLTTANVRRRLRQILGEAQITGVTPHTFRKTVATVLERAGGADLAAEMLGHTSSEITKAHYIEPDVRVSAVTAEILQRLAPATGGNEPDAPTPTAETDTSV